jgi:hypothetical protein
MTLKRFITKEEEERLERIRANKNFIKSEAYSFIKKDSLNEEELKDFDFITNLLKEIIIGFGSFKAFTGKGYIRLEYNWNYDNKGQNPFYGVGYINIKELKEGFDND